MSAYPMITCQFNEETEEYEFNVPIEFVDGYEVHDKETGEFLGWVDAKNHRIVKYVVDEIFHKEENE